MPNLLQNLPEFLSSIRFRLGGVHILLVVMMVTTALTQIRVQFTIADQVAMTEYVSQQRGNLYAMAWSIHHLAESVKPEELNEHVEEVNELLEEVDTIFVLPRIGGAFQEGDGEEYIPKLTDPQLLADLDRAEISWKEYRTAAQAVLSAEPQAREDLIYTMDELLEGIILDVGTLLTDIDTYYETTVVTNRQLIFLFGGSVLFLLISALIIGSQIVRGIIRVELAVRDYANGNIQSRINTNTLFELAQIGRVFNTTANNVNTLVRELQGQVKVANTAREEAERSSQVKSAFLASMSHELRTPLNAIINFSKFVANGVMGPINEQQEETLKEVIDSAEHLHDLINDVLDMSKIESGSLKLFIEDEVNVNIILDSVISTGKILAKDKPIKFITDIDPHLPRVRGDRQRILQIMLNIMSNACKFTDEGFIKLAACQKDSEIQMSIQDTGPGIETGDHGLVFEAFKQTETGLRQGGGTGLGLPISRSLLEAHGGRIWLESMVGHGTTFFVAFPIKAEHLVPTFSLTREAVKA